MSSSLARIVFIILFTVALTGFSSRATAADQALIIAGGCEADNDRFAPSATNWANGLHAIGWDVTLLYGNSKLPGLKVNNGIRNVASPKSVDVFRSLKAMTGKALAGSQALLVLIAHATDTPEGGQKFCVGDADLIDVTSIKPFILDFERRGIRVAMVNEACFGGGAVTALSSTATCVLSPSSDSQYSIDGNFTETLAHALSMTVNKTAVSFRGASSDNLKLNLTAGPDGRFSLMDSIKSPIHQDRVTPQHWISGFGINQSTNIYEFPSEYLKIVSAMLVPADWTVRKSRLVEELTLLVVPLEAANEKINSKPRPLDAEDSDLSAKFVLEDKLQLIERQVTLLQIEVQGREKNKTAAVRTCYEFRL